MVAELTCPSCGATAVPLVQLRSIAICGGCGGTLNVDGESVRLAVHQDLASYDLLELAQLRRARAMRPNR